MPHRAKAMARAKEPSEVIIQEIIEIVPTSASFVGSMMMPAPSMLAAATKVSWTKDILRREVFIISPSFVSDAYKHGLKFLAN